MSALVDMHPKDVERQYGPLVGRLVTDFQELRARHEQVLALVDELLDVRDVPSRRGVELVEALSAFV